ncbi:MAG: tetratricopeptide repeat protein [Bryobacteraceae bacterium]
MTRQHALFAVWMCFGLAFGASPAPKTQALVVGTIHGRHATNENYSYADVVDILATYDPDLICVEIRPQDFRHVPYLKEMMLSTVWGISHGKNVVPIDWWSDTPNDREVEAELAKRPEYIEKEKQFDLLRARSAIETRYEKIYGPIDEDVQWGAHLGYRFWNGKDYNDWYAEDYRLSMQVYGDSPMNLHYLTRNNHMMELILGAIRKYSSRRAIVLTGSEHKHFFDREFRKDADVETLELEGLLPLKAGPLEPAIAKFLDEDDDLAYFEPSSVSDMDVYYAGKLLPLVHGPDMDVFPGRIPAANIERAGKVLERWRISRPESDQQVFEQGWNEFLAGDYAGAIKLFQQLTGRIDAGKVSNLFVRFETYVNLGRSYDMLDKRADALASYRRAGELLVGTRSESAKAYLMQDYETVPFHLAATH